LRLRISLRQRKSTIRCECRSAAIGMNVSLTFALCTASGVRACLCLERRGRNRQHFARRHGCDRASAGAVLGRSRVISLCCCTRACLTAESGGVAQGTLHLNRALANLKLGKLSDALWDCNEVCEAHAEARAYVQACHDADGDVLPLPRLSRLAVTPCHTRRVCAFTLTMPRAGSVELWC
jgi:hypothetical protein